ncbi:double zinc ribbon domain-containing protein [Roseovarius ramblicola]|uniref:Double zinc ribbon domain-containing protein n=1 Tax=Roseovarius ramblicola TaxID=2022336 RepID=A0ABV5HYI7_9RHOB
MALQMAVRLVYPPRCTLCGATVDDAFGLCGACWRDTPFITGLVCDLCGSPLPGDADAGAVHCDDCLATARPWSHGRAALRYDANGRRLVLALKHGDRHDVALPAGKWLARSAQPMLSSGMVVAPVPLHWTRLLARRFNQSALLSRALACETGLAHISDLLVRKRRTRRLKGLDRAARHAALDGAIRVNPRHLGSLPGARLLLVDDVMTSGATFSVAAQICFAAGAEEVCVLALARAARDA